MICVDNLHDLEKTLLQNIINTKEYANLEFVILDYNSKDGTGDWIRENMGAYIEKGILSYFNTFETVAEPGHSKNIAFKLAEGDIICKIRAIDPIRPGFADFINRKYCKHTDSTIVFTRPENGSGLFSMMKRHFLKIRGFDERIDKEGFDDNDLLNRLGLLNISQIIIGDYYRQKNERALPSSSDLYKVFITYYTPSMSEVILLYKDQHYKKGICFNNSTADAANYICAFRKEPVNPEYSIKASEWETGLWKETQNDSILFTPKYRDEYIFLKGYYPYDILLDVSDDLLFLNISENEIIDRLFVYDPAFYSKAVADENQDKEIVTVNPDGFGKASVFKNFNWGSPILV
jgi:hypothetical protein